MGQQYWIKSGEKVRGPFTGWQLMQLASTNRLKPDYLVSKDQTKWIPARKIKGLSSEEPPQDVHKREPEPSSVGLRDPRASRSNDHTDIDKLVRKRAVRDGFVLLYGAAIVVIAASMAYGEITEVTLTGTGAQTHVRGYSFGVILGFAYTLLLLYAAILNWITRKRWTVLFGAVCAVPTLLLCVGGTIILMFRGEPLLRTFYLLGGAFNIIVVGTTVTVSYTHLRAHET